MPQGIFNCIIRQASPTRTWTIKIRKQSYFFIALKFFFTRAVFLLHLSIEHLEKMNFSREFTHGNKVFTAEVSSVDYQKLCKLLEAIIAWAVSHEIKKLLRRDVVDVSMTIPVSVNMIA